MSKELIIVRHGNTFLPNQTPTRVGGSTDLPLVENEKALSVAKWLKEKNCIPDIICAAPLKRTYQTASIIRSTLGISSDVQLNDDFVEIDYGPDENKTEDEVRRRLGTLYFQHQGITTISDDQIVEKGKGIIKEWDNNAIVPKGWNIDVDRIINNWKNFANQIHDNEKVLICSSNGIIRFAPHILGDNYDEFVTKYQLKVATGSISLFCYDNEAWHCRFWNLKP